MHREENILGEDYETNLYTLARDIVLIFKPSGADSKKYTIDFVAKNHNMTVDDIKKLLSTEYFKDIFKSELARVNSRGANAGFIERSSDLLMATQEFLFSKILMGETTDNDIVKFIEVLSKNIYSNSNNQGNINNINNIYNKTIRFKVPNLKNNSRFSKLIQTKDVEVVDSE